MTLSDIIRLIETQKHDRVKAATNATSEESRKRELKAALDLFKVAKKLESIMKTLIPFDVPDSVVGPAPNQKALFTNDPVKGPYPNANANATRKGGDDWSALTPTPSVGTARSA